ncbi:Hypothetical protein, putative [Bodo saltans]|uniref:Complex 1 LYR protein domain-containing protein n=1 Tax=Bodo saltans TaxID=75058 RepID=A0A0S4JR38_BODSA|nr:Hypothetical protein, putative [Bodo saltans]|eukprot:CUG93232.1 Hypothetical protein, putative [Bodo saltans]
MSALLPQEAVCLVYRRYLKATNKIPNVTIRMLLLQQIRFGFRRNQTLVSPAAQRELVRQAHKDLGILEDERLSRTLYINKLGMVSCLDWEVRRTEYHVNPRVARVVHIMAGVMGIMLIVLISNIEKVDDAYPEIKKMVGSMALRLEGETYEDVQALREQQYLGTMERQQHRISLEGRILSTFHDAPTFAQQPSLRYPDGMVRR